MVLNLPLEIEVSNIILISMSMFRIDMLVFPRISSSLKMRHFISRSYESPSSDSLKIHSELYNTMSSDNSFIFKNTVHGNGEVSR